jgi:cob(I)alamin adenosyltransferase
MKIYTKTGDAGETGLWGGGRIGKDDLRIHAYGTVDECNCQIGLVRAIGVDRQLDAILGEIQDQLFIVGTDMATPGDTPPAIARTNPEMTTRLEDWIDSLEQALPPLKQFILPGGHQAAAQLHLARTICRRAERWVASLIRQDRAHAEALKYLNRLSDFLFVAARSVNHRFGVGDTPWNNPRRAK